MNQDTNEPSGFDEHEPGDVNGNVDPAWAKQQKLKAKQPPRGDAQPGAPRPPRAPRTPGNARGPRLPREPREPRAALMPAPAAGVEGGVVADAAPAYRAPDLNDSQANGFANTSAPDTNSEATANVATETAIDAGAPREPRADGERRGRGMRRSRGGGQRRDAQNPGIDSQRTENSGDYDNNDATLQNVETAQNDLFEGRVPTEFAENSGENGESESNPNPGAFGDPSRPMDRSARRNRNRNRKQEDYVERVQKSEAVHAARALRVAAAQSADGTVVVDETQAADRDGERLHKVLAQQGLGSRRAMESLIEAGEVEVNGKPAQVGQVVNERDRVFVKRRKVNIKLGDDNPRIMIYHKPAGEIVTRDDPEARDTVFDRLPRPDHGRWIAIGRLDYNTEGLLLFTTSGELANRMMHPRYEIMREYSVRTLGELTPEQEDELVDGIELDDGPARVLSLDRIDRDSEGANHWYRITINEGRNREVRRMFEHLGLTVSRLIRTRYGAVNMPSWLKRGQYKLLDENDTFNILEAVGMRSRKKLEKAARFGGARGKLPQQGPVGPMRSASEHEAVWSGAPAASAANGALGERRNGRNQRGNSGSGRSGAPRSDGFGSSLSLQQQQFPGFGGGAAVDTTAPGHRRGAARGGARMQRGRGGEVNGNVDPNFRAGRNPRGGRNSRAPTMPDFDEQGNAIVAPPQLAADVQPMAARPNGGRGNPGERGNRNGRNNGNSNPRGRNNRRGQGRDAVSDGNREAGALGVPNDVAAMNAGATVDASLATHGERPRGRNRRGARRGGGNRNGRGDARGGSEAVAAPTNTAPPIDTN